MWICKDCLNDKCSDCGLTFVDLGDAIEHVRKNHFIDIRRPGAVGHQDSHGHVWYCFQCETWPKDHRSFGSNEAMLQHMQSCHGGVISLVERYPHVAYCLECFM